MEPFVSIVIPCFNASDTLKTTLDSIINQDYQNYEIILVDDGSTDKTPAIICHYKNKNFKIQSFRQDNTGVARARNEGVNLAKSEYIAFLDADDIFYKNSITERIKSLLEDKNADLLGTYCPAQMIFQDGSSMGLPVLFNYPLPNDKLYFSFTPESVFNPSCVIVKKEKFLKIGGFDEALPPAEDYDLWHRMMRTGGYFRIVRLCKIGYTQHPISAVRSTLLTHYKQCKIVTERIFSKNQHVPYECQRGFGQLLYYQSLSNRAFNVAIMAIATKKYEVVKEVSPDISKYIMEMTDPSILESRIKFSALRALCKHTRDWSFTVWPKIRKDVIEFITELHDTFGGDCNNLLELKESLEKIGTVKKIPAGLFEDLKRPLKKAVIWAGQSPINKIVIFGFLCCYTLLVVFVTTAIIFFLFGL